MITWLNPRKRSSPSSEKPQPTLSSINTSISNPPSLQFFNLAESIISSAPIFAAKLIKSVAVYTHRFQEWEKRAKKNGDGILLPTEQIHDELKKLAQELELSLYPVIWLLLTNAAEVYENQYGISYEGDLVLMNAYKGDDATPINREFLNGNAAFVKFVSCFAV